MPTVSPPDLAPVSARQRRWSIAVNMSLLVVMVVLIVLERARTYAEPPERDIAGYALIGHEMLRGRELYTDLWERKPPLLYLTFAGAEKWVGYGPGEILLVNIAMALATLVGCYAAGRAVGGASAGLVAAGLWVLLGGDPYMEANQPNCEVFVNAALTAAVALLVRPRLSTGRARLAMGALFTLASMYEQHVIITCGTLSAAYLLAGGRSRFRERIITLGIAASVGVIAWAGLVGYFTAVGRLPAMVDVLFHQLFSQFSLGENLANAFSLEYLFPWFMSWVAGPIVLITLALNFGPDNRHTGMPWIIWAGWAVGTWFFVAVPGWFFPHYYQCWIPPMCIAGGWAAARLLTPNRWPRALGATVVVVSLAILAVRELPPYRWSANEWSNRKYEFDTFVEQAYLAHRLAALLRPDEQFWVLGQDNTIYFLTPRSPVTGLIFLHPVLDPHNTKYWSRLMSDLNRSHPALVIVRFPWNYWLPPGNPVNPWMQNNYVHLKTNLTCPSYDFWVRKEASDLQTRLLNPPPAPPFRRINLGAD